MIPYAELVAAPGAPADHRIAYGTDANQFGDLRLPKTRRAKVPIIVLIHGGCWQAAYDLAHTAGAAAAITAGGFATWTIEYRRLGNGGGFPHTFDDVAGAVNHVRALASQFPVIDTTRVVLAGHSAGGQLALWFAGSGRVAQGAAALRQKLAVRGVVSLAGITDLATYGAGTGGCNAAVSPLIGGSPDEQPQRYRELSPIGLVPIGVPVHLVHGAADPIVPVLQSQAFFDRTRAARGAAQLFIVPDAGHFDLVAPSSEAWKQVMRSIRALATS